MVDVKYAIGENKPETQAVLNVHVAYLEYAPCLVSTVCVCCACGNSSSTANPFTQIDWPQALPRKILSKVPNFTKAPSTKFTFTFQ